ncbi:ATP phosphoribosyltransferase [Aeromicrobium sp. Leaf350]|uniref:ATP phosphoribosyltransferase n=1 Tax=Aeromicrobium sp. Leaf350 TaxID=2876565 RepID=UPI001E31EAAA|nr:ATP phosphoribosyltransferase [Aeromicrobium sp. Leaf350]
MLKVAVPNKGSLAESAALMLAEAGYRQRRNAKDLVCVDAENDVEFFYLRPRDIAIYVGEGTLDIGVTGRDLLLDSGAKADEVMALGFAASTFRFAAPEGGIDTVEDLQGRRIATSYRGIVQAHLAERGIEASVVRLDGAVESSIRLGVADAIADVVETGTTLRQAGLRVFGDPILDSEAVLARRSGSDDPAGFDVFKRRLDSVLVARSYVMMDYDIRTEQVEQAVTLTPGIESPTVSPLHSEGWSAVRSMVPRDRAQRVMDDLYALGARGILVTDILACRI